MKIVKMCASLLFVSLLLTGCGRYGGLHLPNQKPAAAKTEIAEQSSDLIKNQNGAQLKPNKAKQDEQN